MYPKRTRKPTKKAAEAEAAAAAATPVPVSDSDSDAGRTRARRAAAANPSNKRALNQVDFPPNPPPAAKRLTTTAFEPTRDLPTPTVQRAATTTTSTTSSAAFTPINSPGYQGQNTLARFEAIQEDLPRAPQQATADTNYQGQLKEAAEKNEETQELLKFTRESNADLTKRQTELSALLTEAQAQLNLTRQQVATLTQANQILSTQASLLDGLNETNHILRAERDQLVVDLAHMRQYAPADSPPLPADHPLPPDDDIVDLRNRLSAAKEDAGVISRMYETSESKVAELQTQNTALQAQLNQEQKDSAEQIRAIKEKAQEEYDDLETFATTCINRMMTYAQNIRDGVPPEEETME